MPEHFHPTRGRLAIARMLPPAYGPSARLASRVLAEVRQSYRIDLMSWRETEGDAVVYLQVRDARRIFEDRVGGLAVMRPRHGRGRIQVGFQREPAATELMEAWTGTVPIVRPRRLPHPMLEAFEEHADEAAGALRSFAARLLALADAGALKRGITSRPELLLRHAFRRLYPEAQFRRVRPAWLMGQNGRPLELDLYSQVLQLAVEVQGPFHYHPIHGTGQLAAQQARDAWKRVLCRKHGVRLLVVDAVALDREILRLPIAEQTAALRDLIARTEDAGVYAWPSGAAGRTTLRGTRRGRDA